MKNKEGRPTSMTEETIRKLEEIFALGGTDREACLYANIVPSTLYLYQESHPEFTERKEALKETPILKARRTIIDSLDDPETAKWFLSRKRKEEFSERIQNVNENINYDVELTEDERKDLLAAATEEIS